MATFPTILAGQRATASLLTSMLPIIVVKAANETVNNAGPQNDNELVLPVVANASYLLRMQVFCTGPTAADLTTGFTVPTGTTMTWGMQGVVSSAAATSGDVQMETESESTLQSMATFATNTYFFIDGKVAVSSTAGNLQFRWGQNIATVGDTIVYAGSWMRLTRIA